MADHMTAEQLRAELIEKARERRKNASRCEHNSLARHVQSTTAAYLESVAARLSGMAAVPEGHIAIPRDVAALVRRVFLPANPNNMRNAAPETIAATKAFIAAAAPEPPHG